MKASERDALSLEYGRILERLDERSLNTWRTVEKIEAHLEKSNNRLRKVENKVWYIFGMIAVIASVSGVALFFVLS